MKLHIDDIGSGKSRYTIEDQSWFPVEEVGPGMDIVTEVVVYRQNQTTVVVEGRISAQRHVACDRCGELTEAPLSCEFTYRVTTDTDPSLDEDEVECGEDEVQLLHLQGTVVDVNELLREQVLLAVPLKTLCIASCKGICAGCGVVLNNDVCRCETTGNSGPFAVLGKLRKK